MREPQIDWTIIALCRASDPDRKPRFERACNELGATGYIWDLDDSPELAPIDLNLDLMIPLISLLPDQEWDICLTHGPNGEYGHQRHIDVHRAVTELIHTNQLRCKRFWSFAYTADLEKNISVSPEADIVVDLSDRENQRKQHMVETIYGFQAHSFEWNACIGTEGFHQIN